MLAIGIVVDDAIVVVEAVQQRLDTENMSPRKRTVAMAEVGGPVIAIALVLAAVFVPVAFLGGLDRQLYKQFALTLAISVILSAIVALTFTPALCALLLQPVDGCNSIAGAARAGSSTLQSRVRAFARALSTTVGRELMRHAVLVMLTFAAAARRV